jgi:Ribosome biogenesis protein Nop16
MILKEEKMQSETTSPNIEVAERLEKESKERKRKCLRLSQMQVDKLAYYIEKHGQDYQVCINQCSH